MTIYELFPLWQIFAASCCIGIIGGLIARYCEPRTERAAPAHD